MKAQVARNQPWQPERARLALRGEAVLRLAPGEDPEDIGAHEDVQLGAVAAASHVDGGRVDRALKRFTGAFQVSRAFNARRNLGTPGKRHLAWDDLERNIGLSRTFRVRLDPDASVVNVVRELCDLGVVEMASPHYLCEAPFAAPPAAARRTAAYGTALVGAAEALALEPGDSTVIVAVIDSGVVTDHAELQGRLRPGLTTVDLPAESLSRGLKLLGGPSAPGRAFGDDVGHGTACAGIIAAHGYQVPRGMAGAARLLAIRSLAGARLSEKQEPTAIGALGDIDAGVKMAVDLGARVLNLSFGTPETALREEDPVPHAEVIRYALEHDCVLVAAAGNSGDAQTYFPAAFPGVIAVGSVGPTRKPSRFSTHGDHVALCAPGEALPCAGIDADGYSECTGTSFAAPYVAGACALLLARAARLASPLSPFELREVLVRTASPFAAGADATGHGAGVLDVPAALHAVHELLAPEERLRRSMQEAPT